VSEIVMPRLSDSMEEGTILRWLKRDGEHVRRGEELVEIETDKANMTYESDRDGVLQTVAHEGDTLPIGEVIARIGEAEADGEAAAPAREPVVDAKAPSGNGAARAPATDAEAAGQGAGTATPGAEATASATRVKASPLARRIAREQGVELERLTGSGPGGRIVKADVVAASGAQPTADAAPAPVQEPGEDRRPTPAPVAAPSASAPNLAVAKGETTYVEPSRTQRTIARRMAESKATIPDFTLQMDVDMEACVALREELKRLSKEDAPTYNDMIVKACALALREHPRANASFKDGGFELHERVNVGVAVAVEAQDALASALVVPTVFDADQKSLGEIARETRELTARVRDGSITPPQLSGATFTVTNLGMYGVRAFSAIVNPPQAAILAVGAVQQRALARDGQVTARHEMTITLSCDHRVLYGADAALFLARVRELLEEPAALTL
jgi:pyruvate dehydrogenase E2 component (dihydrolipoamide acetyltransferase)